jgi:uncharacterized protein (DUF2141 family)
MNLNKNLHWFIYAIFLLSCARQSSPTGGPKDTIPPILVRVIPRNEAINFKAKEIELIFSENVILNAPKEQLIVTPTIGKEYKIVNRKNSIILSFEDPLKDSTTYTFNFRESVQDITEKNPVRNLQLAYSTGTYIDSLAIEGTVYDMLKGKQIKDATVALHVENDTFNILEHPAVYFTKTDEKGKFKISHLKPDNYYLYAFEDKNRNLIVNSRTEAYGFISQYQYLLENIKDISVGLVRLDAGPLKLTSARPYNSYFNIRTTKNLRTTTLTAADSSDIAYTFGEDQANIRLYKTTDKDSLQIHLLAIDSINNVIDTTLYAKFLTREVTPEKFEISIQSASILAHKGELEARLTTTKPIKEIHFDSLFFQVDSLTRVNFVPDDLTLDPLLRQITIRKRLDKALFETGEALDQQRTNSRAQPAIQGSVNEKKKKLPLNEFTLGTAAFISIENDSSKRLTLKIKPSNEQDLSIINVEIKTNEKSFLVELIDNSYKIIRQSKNKLKVRWEDLTPGDYQIRLIIDSNENGRWDPGNYFENDEPEKIVYYRAADGSTTIKGVKANWDIGAGEMFITY